MITFKRFTTAGEMKEELFASSFTYRFPDRRTGGATNTAALHFTLFNGGVSPGDLKRIARFDETSFEINIHDKRLLKGGFGGQRGTKSLGTLFYLIDEATGRYWDARRREARERGKKERGELNNHGAVREERIGVWRDILKLKTEAHGRIALAFSCIIFALIGIPLGILAKKGNTSVGLGIAALVVTPVYYPLVLLGEGVAKAGALEPIVAVWLANIVVGITGLVLLRKQITT